MKVDQYELDTPDRELMVKLREAVEHIKNGETVRGVLDEDDIAEALRLLVDIVDEGCAG
jgi:hypothetical protein